MAAGAPSVYATRHATAHNVDCIESWLQELGLGQHAAAFRDNDIDSEVLPELSDADLKDLGLSLGHRRKLLKAIAALYGRAGGDAARPAAAAAHHGDGGEALPAQRRQLTVLFCDLVGSTALSVRFDPEELSDIIAAYQACCREIIETYGGYLARYLGDGIMVYFGYPGAHEDDAERAVRVALAINAAVGGLEVRPELRLQTRIGIATGEVVVGEIIGDGSAREEAAVGETPNLAARLQSVAEPDAVVVAESTRRIVGTLFEYADLGRHTLKGFAEPVQAWQVVAEREVESRFEALHAGESLGALVGREEETGVLLRRWQRARAGSGQAVLLVGQPGIGKSRLIEAVRDSVANEPHTLLRFYCSPYHQSSALHPVIAQLERSAAFAREDAPRVKLEKLEALLRESVDDVDPVLPLFAALLSLPVDEGDGGAALSPEQQKERTLDALEQRLTGLARHAPVLAVFEDLHWADPSTRELLDRLVECVARSPVLLLMTCRPEFGTLASDASHVTVLNLKRLDEAHGIEIIEELTGGRTLPAEVLREIVSRTDGIPLFVEELTKAVLEGGHLVEDGDRLVLRGGLPSVVVPSTLHDSLVARLDRLAPVREIAQLGAVIGRSFPFELIAAISKLEADALAEALEQLSEAELVHRRGTPPRASYTFKHTLVRDAAYGSMLKSQRQKLHGLVADALEQGFPEIAGAEPEVLARHFAEAGRLEQAIDYWQAAGRHAIRRSANLEAVQHLKSALALLGSNAEQAGRASKEFDLRVALGSALMASKNYADPEVEQTYQSARALAEKMRDDAHLFTVLRGLWNCYYVQGRFRKAASVGENLLALAARVKDPSYYLIAHQALGQTLVHTGQFARALAHFERGVEIFRAERELRYGRDSGVFCLGFAPLALWCLGFPQRALAWSEEALARAREIGHPFTVAQTLGFVALLHLLRRDAASARALAEEAMRVSEEYVFPYWAALAAIVRGWAVAADAGRPEDAVAALTRGMTELESMGAMALRPWFLTLLAQAQGASGETARAEDTLEEAHRQAGESGEHAWDAEILRVGAQQAARCGETVLGSEAQAGLMRSLDVARRQQAKSWELCAATALAQLWRDEGERDRARELLSPIREWFADGAESADLSEAEAVLRSLS